MSAAKSLVLRPGVLLFLGLVLLSLQMLGFHDLRHDDAYVTYRYGQNIAEGYGPVFNRGERLMGSTSAGHVLLSAAMIAIFGHSALPTVMVFFGCLGWLAQAGGVGFLLRRAVGDGGAVMMALVVAAGGAGSNNWLALETNLVVALTIWTLWAAQTSRWKTAALLAGLGCLFRPDAWLLALLVAAICVWRTGRAFWKPALIFVAVALPWVIFAWWYFGTPLPQSAVPKFQRTGLAAYGSHILQHVPAITLTGGSWMVAVVGWLVPAAGAVLLLRRDRGLWPLVAYGVLHLLAYLWLRPFRQHTWHLYPGVLVMLVLSLAALWLSTASHHSRVVRSTGIAAVAAFIAMYGMRTVSSALSHRHEYWNGARDAAYRRASEYLLQHADLHKDRVAVIEVGTIGYLTGMKMHDLGGLITRSPWRKIPKDVRWIAISPTDMPPFVDGRSPEPVAIFKRGGFEVWVVDLNRPSLWCWKGWRCNPIRRMRR